MTYNYFLIGQIIIGSLLGVSISWKVILCCINLLLFIDCRVVLICVWLEGLQRFDSNWWIWITQFQLEKDEEKNWIHI
ncbi:unnamed protein product [Malus baccata var. baccata]|uniref:Uncharacterized protein n=1 Tax=Malus domestica TaxID=3750 RepID=A0A498J8Q8_MALDO|nr:hypothetical protein DVH24_032138 [Malus domestica]